MGRVQARVEVSEEALLDFLAESFVSAGVTQGPTGTEVEEVLSGAVPTRITIENPLGDPVRFLVTFDADEAE